MPEQRDAEFRDLLREAPEFGEPSLYASGDTRELPVVTHRMERRKVGWWPPILWLAVFAVMAACVIGWSQRTQTIGLNRPEPTPTVTKTVTVRAKPRPRVTVYAPPRPAVTVYRTRTIRPRPAPAVTVTTTPTEAPDE